MEINDYLEYFKDYFKNLPNFRKEKIKKYLLDNHVCPSITDKEGKIVDNSKKNVNDFVMQSILENSNAVFLVQKFELFRNYKYSLFYYINNRNNQNIKDSIMGKQEIFFDIEKNIEKFNFFKDEKGNKIKINKCFYFIEKNKIYIKFPIGLERYDEIYFQTFKTKMTFLCILDLEKNILEVRYDGLYTPFRTTQDFYLQLENEIILFLMSYLNIELKSKKFDFIYKEIDNIKKQGFIIVRKESEYNDQGGAKLSCNKKNMLPYIDDLKELLKYKLEQFEKNTGEYEIANEISREILQFINEKEEESNCTNIVLQINDYRTHFNYLDNENLNCIIQHEYMDTKNDEGRGDYVREVILQLENEFNKVGSSRD